MVEYPRTADAWNSLIQDAVETPDPVLSNFKITRSHYLLSLALREAIGAQAGANFHSWAVWGSRKAGVTIRQEDKDRASRDATLVAGVVGLLTGAAVGWSVGRWIGWSLTTSIGLWVTLGIVTGGYCGYLLAGYTRRAASRLILEGNRLVLDDIGRQTARYLDYVQATPHGDEEDFAGFLSGFREGSTERGGQDLLRDAFRSYERARRTNDPKVMHESNYHANCLAVLHEHVKLQPYISRSLPFLISKCVTQRLMTYSVGEELLAVHEDVPPLDSSEFPPTLATIESAELQEFLVGPDGWDSGRGSLKNTRTKDWTNIRERMGYIVNLFRTRHLDANVTAPPYTPQQLDAVAADEMPARPW